MNYKVILTSIIATVAAAGGCGGKPPEPVAAVAWGSADRVVEVGNLYFAGQPDPAGLAAARAAGVDIVINLRPPEETDFDAAAATAANGMQYFNVSVSRDGPSFDPGAIDMISELVAANADKQILLYCSSGNRVSGWYAIHLARQRGMPLEQALQAARRTGMMRTATEERVAEYLGTRE